MYLDDQYTTSGSDSDFGGIVCSDSKDKLEFGL